MSDSDSAADPLDELACEFVERHRRGERPALSEYIARYPHLADDIREVFPALILMEQARAGPETGSEKPAAPPPLERLGDYRIVREVGRGGMGIVYEAEQESLGRHVAVKVLPFAAALDGRRLQRFKNEAQAAAQLHHQNIVPVYAVGCERGVHYFAMQFIEGRTLGDLIDELRRLEESPVVGQPAVSSTPLCAALTTERSAKTPAFFRSMAQMGVQAAEALEHAHQLGIVHRDVKPANLLVDVRGNLWITDFGLAHFQNDTRLTLTGDMVGTLRYMSPEQALARREGVDHRTDVYSLGATLYEMLTLKHAFDGRTRQELLRQIAQDEPRPLRRVNQAVPAELETVVLKAMAKAPAERYATAQEMADDLHRFLEDRPIHARRPSLWQRTRKWARRHRAVVLTATAGLVLAFVVLAGSVGWAARDRAARKAEREEQICRALEQTEAFFDRDRLSEALVALEHAEKLLPGEGIREEFGRQVRQWRTDLDMLLRLEEIRARRAGPGEDLVDDMEKDAAYRSAFRDYGVDVGALSLAEAADRLSGSFVRVGLAAALDNWAAHRDHLRKTDAPNWKDLLALARTLDDNPWRNQVREALAAGDKQALRKLAASDQVAVLQPATAVWLATALVHLGADEEALTLLRKVHQLHPDDYWINQRLALYSFRRRPPQYDQAVRHLTAALAVRPTSLNTRVNLGAALTESGAQDEAIAALRQALALDKNEAVTHHNLGVALHRKGDVGKAMEAFREAIRLNKNYPSPHCSLGTTYQEIGQPDLAMASFREAIRLNPQFARAYCNMANALVDKGQLDQAIDACHTALRLDSGLAAAHVNLSRALLEKGLPLLALEHCDKALRIQKNNIYAQLNRVAALANLGRADEALAAVRRVIDVEPHRGQAHFSLGQLLEKKGQLDDSLAAYRKAAPLLSRFALVHYCIGNVLRKQTKYAAAIPAFQEALRINPNYAEAHCDLGNAYRMLGRFPEALAEFERGHKLGSQQPNWPFPSGAWVKEVRRQTRLDALLEKILKGDAEPANAAQRLDLAILCLHFKSMPVIALRFWQEAFTAQPEVADNPHNGHRGLAACAAVLAGLGEGDAAKLDDKERTRWRKQALTWLRADLTFWNRQVDTGNAQSSMEVRTVLRHWQKEPDLALVRDASALARLPEMEQVTWRQLWADVAKTLSKAQ
jgi:serine/threonine protein kinase/Flp pilus assembly protein TadD